MDNDYTPQDAGNSTHQVGDKFYKTVGMTAESMGLDFEEQLAENNRMKDIKENISMKQEEVLLDLLTVEKDEDNIY